MTVAAKETVSGHKGGFIFGSLVEGCDAGQGGGGLHGAVEKLRRRQEPCRAGIVFFQFFHDSGFRLPHVGAVAFVDIVVSGEMEHAVDGVEEEFAGRIQLVVRGVLDGDFWADIDFGGDAVVKRFVLWQGGLVAEVECQDIRGAMVLQMAFVEFRHPFCIQNDDLEDAGLILKSGVDDGVFQRREKSFSFLERKTAASFVENRSHTGGWQG